MPLSYFTRIFTLLRAPQHGGPLAHGDPGHPEMYVSFQKAVDHVCMRLRRTYCIILQSSGTAEPPPAGEACWQMCDGWEKKVSSQKDSRLKILQARAIDRPRTGVCKEPKREAGRSEFSLSRDLVDL